MTELVEIVESVISDAPIGEVKLGAVDPRGLSPEDFKTSGDLLFHGSASEFEFSQDHVIDFASSPHSHMLGPGFYATPDRQDAEWFSETFQGYEKDKARAITEVLPFQAKMFDFREKSDPTQNSSVPVEMVEAYRNFFVAQHESRYKDYDPESEMHAINNARKQPVISNNPMDTYFPQRVEGDEEIKKRTGRLMFFSKEKEYRSFLNSLIGKKDVNLRSMLSIDGDGSRSEYGGGTFKNFMTSLGYDGIIYREGGDHPEHRKTQPVSYVFYNLKKVGTHEAWGKNSD